MIRSIAGFSISMTFLALVAACGDAPPPASPTPPAPTDSTPAAPTASAPTAMPSASAAPTADPAAAAVPTVWSKDMTKEQQMAFMKKNVMPAMGPVFTGHTAKKDATVGCTTCHGPAYKDPHEFLPKLTVKDGMPTAFKEKPEVAKFMATEVVPKMAAAMGQQPYDPKTKQGFGCGGCHAMDMK